MVIFIYMLDFLVSADARRKLLMVLFGGEADPRSLGELARRAGVPRASAHRELRKMQDFGLVISDRHGPRERFRASETEASRLLRRLVQSAPEPVKVENSARGELRALGAPLWVEPREPKDVEDALVRGAQEAHADPNLATVLPLSFAGAAARDLDSERLLQLARDAGEKAAVGFFLDLTGVLAGDRRLRRWATSFRDRRRGVVRPFFPGETRFVRMLAERNTPPLARAWGFRMNLPMEAFATAYGKHART
jgi:DNA-binding MarR family transcriptional regulator